jgi:ADP-heptose:LPS heptosyltransferase
MNVKALQRTDRWLGVPLCFLLTVVRFIFGRSAPDCSRPPRSLLFVKLAEQGSTVLAYAAWQRAVKIVGRENIYFIAFEDNRFILDALEIIPEQNVITVSVRNRSAFLRSMLSAIRRLRGLRLDAAIDMDFFSRGSAALTFLSGAKRRVGFHAFFGAGPYRGNLMTHRLIYNPHLHTSQTFLTLVEGICRNPEALPTFDLSPSQALDETPQFVPGPDELAKVKEILHRETGGCPPLLLLNPNSSDLLPLRRWPTERYVELAGRLLAKYPEAFMVFTGAPEEAAAAAELVRRVGSNRCISLAGKTTLRQLLVLYTLSEVLVTNDSGPAHFATLTPIHIVTLFGPETPELFAARTSRNTVLWAGIACSPCVNAYNNRRSPCRDNQCMQAINVDQVFAATCRAYEQRVQFQRDASARKC